MATRIRGTAFGLHYTFRVLWDGAVIAGISQVSALARVAEVVEYREGGDPAHSHPMPGSWKFEPVTLERGVTHDGAFEDWVALAVGNGSAPFRKSVRIELFDSRGRPAMIYELHRCWPSRYAAFERLEAGRHRLMESLTLQYEGWDRQPPLKLIPAPHRRRP